VTSDGQDSRQDVGRPAERSDHTAEEERVKYLMLVYADESIQVSAEDADVKPWVAEMERRG
jgi:hypothetical protein